MFCAVCRYRECGSGCVSGGDGDGGMVVVEWWNGGSGMVAVAVAVAVLMKVVFCDHKSRV